MLKYFETDEKFHFISRKKKDENGTQFYVIVGWWPYYSPIFPNMNTNPSGTKNGTKYSRMDQVKSVEDSL